MSFFSFQDIISCTTGILIVVALILTLELVTRKAGAGPPPPPIDLESLKADIAAAEKTRTELDQRRRSAEETLAGLKGGGPVTQAMLDDLRKRVGTLHENNDTQTSRITELEREHDASKRESEDLKSERDRLYSQIQDLAQQIEREKAKVKVALIGKENSTKKPLLVECAGAGVWVGEVTDSREMRELKSFSGSDQFKDFLRWAQTRSKDREYFVLLMRPDAVDAFGTIAGTLNKVHGFEVGWDVLPASRSLFAGN